MNSKSFIVLSLLVAFAFGKGQASPSSLNDLRGMVSNNIETQVNQKINNNIIGNVNDISSRQYQV